MGESPTIFSIGLSRARRPSIETIFRIATVLEVRPSEIIRRVEERLQAADPRAGQTSKS